MHPRTVTRIANAQIAWPIGISCRTLPEVPEEFNQIGKFQYITKVIELVLKNQRDLGPVAKMPVKTLVAKMLQPPTGKLVIG